MSFEEEFDKIIRRKAEETEYPFDQNSWQKVSTLLDAERKVKGALKLKRFYLPAALTVLLGSAGFVTYTLINNNTASNTLALQQKNEIEANLVSPTKEQKINGFKEEAYKMEEVNKDVQSTVDSKIIETVTNHKDSKNNKVKTLASKEIKNSANDSEVFAKNDTQNLEEFLTTETVGYTASSKKTSEKKPLNASSKVKNVPTVSGAKNLSNSSLSQKKDRKSVAGNSASSESLIEDGLAEQKPSDNIGERIASDTKEFEMATKPETADQEELSVVSAEQLKAVQSLIPIALHENSLKPTEFVFLNRYEDDYYKSNASSKKHYLNVGLGANYLLGWDANNGKDAQGFNWFAGFNYGRYLSKKIDLSFGIQAYNIANIKQPFYLISEKEYGFGSTEVYTRVTTSQLYYLAIPLIVNYSINSNNKIGLGINAAYLLNAKSNVVKYYVLDNEEKIIESASTNEMGIYKGTRMTNLLLSAQYKTQISKRVGLNLEFNYGLTDIFKNEGSIHTKESPIGIRIGLSYTMFDK